jgi:NTP pyrophosphatase (non-canonical NTP hydrolase)
LSKLSSPLHVSIARRYVAKNFLTDFFRDLQGICHSDAVRGGWWHDVHTKEPIERDKGGLLCLIHSEVSEAMEGERKGLMDDKLPHRKMAEVELADAIIRICDYAGASNFDLGAAIAEKLEYNRTRDDHKPENRAKTGGKSF